MKYNWTEITTLRNPSRSKPIVQTPVVGETDGKSFSNTLTIPPFTTSVESVYYIQLTVSLTNKQISVSDQIQIVMVTSPL
jgi:hypothetical protein